MEDNEKTILDYLKLVSPGTPLRTVIEDLLKTNLGALIVFDCEELRTQNMFEGGFKVNCLFTPQRLFELTKMDGGIIVSPDLKRILSANALLTPDPTIYTSETGTRHKAAERTSKQAKTFVIAVSERKKKTTLYYGNTKYILRNAEELLREVSTDLQMLEKQREIFDDLLSKLNILEVSSLVSVNDVCRILQRTQMMIKISEGVKRYFTELGREGSIMSLRYKELLRNIDKTKQDIIRDYSSLKLKRTETILSNMTFEGLLDLGSIARLLIEKETDQEISPKGFRLLSRTSIDEKEAAKLVEHFKNLASIMDAPPEELEKIVKNRTSTIKNELNNLREQILEGKAV